jgi:hypothetical protein
MKIHPLGKPDLALAYLSFRDIIGECDAGRRFVAVVGTPCVVADPIHEEAAESLR